MNIDSYTNLANAIIEEAVKDYLKVLKRIKTNPYDDKANKEQIEIESFFMSSWFEVLTDLNPVLLIKELKSSIEK